VKSSGSSRWQITVGTGVQILLQQLVNNNAKRIEFVGLRGAAFCAGASGYFFTVRMPYASAARCAATTSVRR